MLSRSVREISRMHPRALSLTVKPMIAGGVLDRVVQDGYPPSPSACYRLDEAGLALLACL